MNITNRGDTTSIILDSGITVEFDAPKMRRLTGNEQARYIGQLLAAAVQQAVEPKEKPRAHSQQSPVQEVRQGPPRPAQEVAAGSPGQLRGASGATSQEETEEEVTVPGGCYTPEEIADQMRQADGLE